MKIVQAVNNQAPIILIYGDPGRGKSTLAAKFPDSVAMLFERGLPRGVLIAQGGIPPAYFPGRFHTDQVAGALRS